MLGGEFGQSVADRDQIIRGEQALGMQHLGMRDRGSDVVRHEPIVQRVILAGGVTQNALVERRPFVPQSAHPACCSAALRTLMFSTTSVPVPSFVNTSARMLSVDLYEV